MIELQGKHNTAKVFTNNIDNTAISQIIELLNEEFISGSKVRIMPDCHAGAGCVIGTTLTITDKVVPNLVGVDIGCGVEVVKIKEKEINLERLDEIIKEFIPSGFNIRNSEHEYVKHINFDDLKCKDHINLDRAKRSICSLGSGNHFLECNKDNEGNIYIVAHSGSRYLGKQVAEYYQELGFNELSKTKDEISKLVSRLQKEGRHKEIETEIRKIKPVKVNKALAYIEGENLKNYLNDMEIVQEYATYNRKAMIGEIIKHLNLTVVEQFTTIHNYIDLDNMILRKGAISAQKGEKIVIPINMRDGSIIAIGKGNPDWNYSAPHGAGRLMSRGKAKESITLEEFKESMIGIYTSSVNQSTIDESAFAYKPMEEIVENIGDTVDIIGVIKPIYNYKSN